MNYFSFFEEMESSTIEPKQPLSTPKHNRENTYESLYRRSLELTQKKNKRYQESLTLKYRNEFKETHQPQIKFYHSPPEFPLENSDIWDEDGTLIPEDQRYKRARDRSKAISPGYHNDKDNTNDPPEKTEKLSPEIRKQKIDDFLSRIAQNEQNRKKSSKSEQKKKMPKRPSNVSKQKFNDFLKRQDESARNKIKKSPRPKQKHFISEKSEKLAQKAINKIFTKEVDEEYTYRPDLSLSSNYKASGIPIVFPEAHMVLKDINLNSLKVAKEDQEIEECTFTPVCECPKERTEKLARREENRQRNRSESQISNNSLGTDKNENEFHSSFKPRKSPFVDPFRDLRKNNQTKNRSPSPKK
ncbi:hypothetical protein TRFO_38704 [Tritrichomonas foetus]|uniref:Uncharacterized protein n=1 Tax=Tritrichomonas foetus TaxID=1144522 RepID=A0A1J4JA35_9EUKA|nr:hypothetical protein TRFO_38704 [Tritrichomonas foetus]|eukprot:OHS95087.1 hypothetical protein TRFO_38704 [Tritrichomonas foetus]